MGALLLGRSGQFLTVFCGFRVVEDVVLSLFVVTAGWIVIAYDGLGFGWRVRYDHFLV